MVGAVIGGLVAFALDERLLAGAFAIMLVYVAISMARRRGDSQAPSPAVTNALAIKTAANAGDRLIQFIAFTVRPLLRRPRNRSATNPAARDRNVRPRFLRQRLTP